MAIGWHRRIAFQVRVCSCAQSCMTIISRGCIGTLRGRGRTARVRWATILSFSREPTLPMNPQKQVMTQRDKETTHRNCWSFLCPRVPKAGQAKPLLDLKHKAPPISLHILPNRAEFCSVQRHGGPKGTHGAPGRVHGTRARETTHLVASRQCCYRCQMGMTMR